MNDIRYQILINLKLRFEYRLRLGMKNKQVCFVLLSACTIFATNNQTISQKV